MSPVKRELMHGIPFNRAKARANFTHFTYNEAWRIRGPVYDVVVNELLIAGCPKAANYFKCLSEHEHSLYITRIIRYRVIDNRELLNKLVENCKKAEYAMRFKQCNHYSMMFKSIYTNVELLQCFGTRFDWLIRDIFDIISNLADIYEEELNDTCEELARIYFKYGLYLHKKDESSKYQAIDCFAKSLQMCRCNLWMADENFFEKEGPLAIGSTLHQLVGAHMASLFLDFTLNLLSKNVVLAMDLTLRALSVIMEVGPDYDRALFYRGNLIHAMVFMQRDEYPEALKILDKVPIDDEKGTDQKSLKLMWEYALRKAECYMVLNETVLAKEKLSSSIGFSRQLTTRGCEADTLLQVAKLYHTMLGRPQRAKKAFRRAKRIYVEVDDKSNTKKTMYFLAQMKADQLRVAISKIMKSAEVHYCHLFRLRLWKNLCVPFWEESRDFPQSYYDGEDEEEIQPEPDPVAAERPTIMDISSADEMENDKTYCLMHEFDSQFNRRQLIGQTLTSSTFT